MIYHLINEETGRVGTVATLNDAKKMLGLSRYKLINGGHGWKIEKPSYEQAELYKTIDRIYEWLEESSSTPLTVLGRNEYGILLLDKHRDVMERGLKTASEAL